MWAGRSIFAVMTTGVWHIPDGMKGSVGVDDPARLPVLKLCRRHRDISRSVGQCRNNLTERRQRSQLLGAD